MYYIQFNTDPIDYTHLDIENTSPITIEDLDNNLCRKVFDNNLIMNAISECSFVLYYKDEKIKGILCVTVYGNMWEISYICVSPVKKGLGSRLIDKLKNIASTYKSPIILYGLGLYEGSQKLYEKNGFIDNTFEVRGKRTRRRLRRSRRRIRFN